MKQVGLTREAAKQLYCIPAMATVFATDGLEPKDAPIDYGGQRQLLEFLISGGVDAILVCGTTGEASTMPHQEQLDMIRWTVEAVNGRVPVIAGAGSNCTAEAVRLTKGAMEAGVKAVLSVKPYYNKPTSEGMLEHYRHIAEVGMPFITYSVSSRHGGGAIPINVIKQLAAQYPHMIGHKEAEGEIKRFFNCPTDIAIWSGDDSITAEAMSHGWCNGVISVAANVIPDPMRRMTHFLADANAEAVNATQCQEMAAEINNRFSSLFGNQGLFLETNPTPVKYVLWKMGIIPQACYRLPIVPMRPGTAAQLLGLLQELGLLS